MNACKGTPRAYMEELLQERSDARGMHIHDIAWLIALVSSFFLSAFNFAGAVIFLMLWNVAILMDVRGADEQVGIYIPIHKYKHIKPENIHTYTQRMNQTPVDA